MARYTLIKRICHGSLDIVETLILVKLISCVNIPDTNKRMLNTMLPRQRDNDLVFMQLLFIHGGTIFYFVFVLDDFEIGPNLLVLLM